jgi:Uma2 family endonuclease
MAANARINTPHHYTLEEYFALEKVGDARYEYWDGELFCMSGGSKQHYRLSSRIHKILGAKVDEQGCETFTGDIPIKTPKLPPYRYPDAAVVCGDAEFVKMQGLDVLVNPILIVEVLSPSTEAVDKDEKRKAYQAIQSLREYLLISQSEYSLTLYSKIGDIWSREIFTDFDAKMSLHSIKAEFSLQEIYRGIPLTCGDTNL